MASRTPKFEADSQTRASALRHAQSIQEKKKMQTRIIDLILGAFDLPSLPDADPARPALPDVKLFKECLNLFQPSDLRDLIYERNVDNKCGYALCPKPNKKIPQGGQKVWNGKGGQDFKLVDKAEMERWCSKICEDRNKFVLAQLSTEPAWLRSFLALDRIRLLDEVQQDGDLAAAFQELSVGSSSEAELAEKLRTLSIERGAASITDNIPTISVVENRSQNNISLPPRSGDGEVIDGLCLDPTFNERV